MGAFLVATKMGSVEHVVLPSFCRAQAGAACAQNPVRHIVRSST